MPQDQPQTARPAGKARRRALWAAAVAVVLAAGWTAGWYHLAGVFRAGIERWAEARRADGMAAGWTALEMGGFPFTWTARLSDPAVARERPAAGWFWRGTVLTLRWRPWSPQRVAFTAPGAHRLGPDPALAATAVAVDAAVADGYLETGAGGALRRLVLHLRDAAVAQGARAPARLAEATATLESFAPHTPKPPAVHEMAARLAVKISGLTLPENPRPALGRTIERIALTAALMERVAPGPLADALAAWSARGGTVELESLALGWGRLAVDGDGTLALDSALQPVASLGARITGHAETADALVAAGAINPRQAFMAKVVLGALAQTPANGGAAEIRVPVTVQEGRLFVGPVALLRLPTITWPGR